MLIRAGVMGAAVAAAMALAGCGGPTESDGPNALQEVQVRYNTFPNYPQVNRTYLSFDFSHGFQVNYLGPDGKAWLWYPGNRSGVPEDYKTDTIAGNKAICWRHPSNSYNPVTKRSGGPFRCTELLLSQKRVVSELPGDPYSLRSGKVPYILNRCTAPEAFQFDRERFGC